MSFPVGRRAVSNKWNFAGILAGAVLGMFIVYTPPLHVVFGGSFHLSPLYWLISVGFGVLLLVWASIRVVLLRKSMERSRVKDIKGLMMCKSVARLLPSLNSWPTFSPNNEDNEHEVARTLNSVNYFLAMYFNICHTKLELLYKRYTHDVVNTASNRLAIEENIIGGSCEITYTPVNTGSTKPPRAFPILRYRFLFLFTAREPFVPHRPMKVSLSHAFQMMVVPSTICKTTEPTSPP